MFKFAKKKIIVFIYFALAAGTLLVFWQVRNFDFINLDDNCYVYQNPHVLKGLTDDGVIWAFITGYASNWHPLTWLSLMLDCQLFGPNPGRIHLVNLFLHIANTLLLFALLKKITGSLWPSAFVAAAFALHPMHVESVAWIAERKDVLSTLFWLLTLSAYAGYVKRPSIFRYLISLVLFALGLLTKPMLVTLPFVLLLFDYWPLDRFGAVKKVKTNVFQKSFSSLVLEKIPFFALVVISSVVTFLVQRSSGAVININAHPLRDRVANAFLSYAKYIGKMFWPENIAVFYPFNAEDFSFWWIMFCALLLIGISFLVIRFGRKQKYLPVGWFWFIGTLIPVIGLVQVGTQAYADRYTYIPYIGLFIMIAWGLPQLVAKLALSAANGWQYRKIALGIAAAIVLTALGISAYRQVRYWNNSTSLFTHAIKVTRNNYLAHYNLGNVSLSLGRYQDAIDAYKQANRIKPDYAEVHGNLGNACLKLGRHQDAIEAYKQAVRIKPDLAGAHYNLGVAYLVTGDKASALEEYKILKTLDVERANKLFNLIK